MQILDYAAIKERLYSCKSKAEGIAYITSLNLRVNDIKLLAKQYHGYLGTATKKVDMISWLVQTTVMAVLDTAAIHRT